MSRAYHLQQIRNRATMDAPRGGVDVVFEGDIDFLFIWGVLK